MAGWAYSITGCLGDTVDILLGVWGQGGFFVGCFVAGWIFDLEFAHIGGFVALFCGQFGNIIE